MVSRYGLIAYASSLDQIGPISRDVRDSADMMTVIAGHDPMDSTSLAGKAPDFRSALGAESLKGKLLGVPKEYLASGMEEGTRRAFGEALRTLESLGARVEETSLPMTDHALAAYYIIAPSEASANLARYDGFKYGYSAPGARTAWETMDFTRGDGFGPEVKRRILLGAYALSSGYYDAYYRKAQQVRTLIKKEFAAAFGRFDALVTPTSPTVAFKLGEKTGDPLMMYLSDACTIPVNIAGLPAVSVPGGMSGGMPVGLQFIGAQMSDVGLLGMAYAYEQATPWHPMRPPL
jgi:aspartyl-tRNA(Asn)/glutamyl-tRNA(Gln) amidotransferase subunit A